MATDIDLTAIQRILDDQAPAPNLTRSEALYAAGLLTADGHTAASIADRLGVSSRTIVRWRKHPIPQPADAGEMPAAPWQDSALCAQVGPAYFFAPDDDTDDDAPLYSSARARAICIRCPVRAACLDDAMAREGDADRHARSGVWGGLTPTQRAALAQVHATEGRCA